MSTDPIQDRIGSATLSPAGPVEAGSYARFALIYTAGFYGIDDTGSLQICWRFASDMATPQFVDPAGPGYVSLHAPGGARLEPRFDPKGNTRPWDRTLSVKVLNGTIREGDTITVFFGDPAGGSPGIRMQTFCEGTFELKVLVDPIATFRHYEVPGVPTLRIVPGPAAAYRAHIPTLGARGQPFRLLVKAEDRWGNPSPGEGARLECSSNLPVRGLPREILLPEGSPEPLLVWGIVPEAVGELRLTLRHADGRTIETNPLRVVERPRLRHFWGDMHAQSEETIGTNSVTEYFRFARDCAGLDFASHQGNDFQITRGFWRDLENATRSFNTEGLFVTFPGYEWSGNTELGGDHNVYFRSEGETLMRSSHALVDDPSDLGTDCPRVDELFRRLPADRALVFAHVGGRYANLDYHDDRLQRSVEIHSAWGTFEWLLEDAFDRGQRVGVVGASDDHKGRPGASYPGASLFGAPGGLTCVLATELTREAVWEAFARRRHYATTGARVYLEVTALGDLALVHDGPSTPAEEATMGEIIRCRGAALTLRVDVAAASPIERIEIRNGRRRLETLRPYGAADLGSRIRIVWGGAARRGRGRQVTWSGSARIEGNGFASFLPVGFWNPERAVRRAPDGTLEFQSVTTGGSSGIDCMLDDPRAGILHVQTPLVSFSLPVEQIGLEDHLWEAGGLARRISVHRLPDANGHTSMTVERTVVPQPGRDNPLYVCARFEDGHAAWSSPIYVVAAD